MDSVTNSRVKQTRVSPALKQIEVDLLVEGIFRLYGYDFRAYARPSLTRRVALSMSKEQVGTVSALQDRILHDTGCMARLVEILSVNTTAMFRNPEFFLLFRKKVIPKLRTYPFVRIWLAGCSTGEEIYSMAILLKEEGLYDRTQIYATDMCATVVQKAKQGIYPVSAMREYTRNYQDAGGTQDFSSYYTAKYGNAVFRSDLKKKVVFSLHNLVTDTSFNEFNVILCRNVMIYFSRQLQTRVFRLFHDSLVRLGYLGLGSKESMLHHEHQNCYKELKQGAKLYRRVK